MQCTPLQAAGAGPRAPRRQQRWRLRCGRGVLTVDLVWRELIGGGYRGVELGLLDQVLDQVEVSLKIATEF